MMNKVKTMKAQTVWLYLVASFLLIVSFSSCSNQNEQTENTGNRNQVEKREAKSGGECKDIHQKYLAIIKLGTNPKAQKRAWIAFKRDCKNHPRYSKYLDAGKHLPINK